MLNSSEALTAVKDFLEKHPVRKEITGQRNLEFSQWLRNKCRPSKAGCFLEGIDLGGFTAYDLDFILWDYRHRLLQLLEVKTNNGQVSWSQSRVLSLLDQLIRYSAEHFNVQYLGLHILVMDGLSPTTSDVITWDGDEITKEQCWRRVNMLDYLEW